MKTVSGRSRIRQEGGRSRAHNGGPGAEAHRVQGQTPGGVKGQSTLKLKAFCPVSWPKVKDLSDMI